MSFAQKAESPVLSPATPDRRNTFREAEAVPFGVGFLRLAPKWITDRFNDHWSNGKNTGQAYCSVAGILCHGPIQHLRAVYVGGEGAGVLDITRPTNPADPNYYYIEFEFGGADRDLGPSNICRLYWGDEAQPADTWLASTSGQDHPPYRGQAYVVFRRLHCGQITAGSQARPALPNVEFTIVRLPSPSMPSGLRIPSAVPAGVERLRGANAVSGIWDILTHPRGGLGLTSSLLDESDWTAKAAALDNGTKPAGGMSGVDCYLSPLLTGQGEAEKVVADALSYLDGWVYTEAGKIRLDWFPNDGSIPDPLPELSEHDHIEPPSVKTASLADSPTTVVVECLEGDSGELDLVDAVEQAPVPFVREIVGSTKTKKIQRPWLTSREVAAKYAARGAATATIPDMEGESVVRLDRAVRLDATPLRVGDQVRINYAPLSLLVVARITERLEDETTATIRWQRERGVPNLPYSPAVDPRVGYDLPDPAQPGTGDWAIVEAPSGLSADAALLVLARRSTDAYAGVRVYLDEDGNWATGSTLLGSQGFAAKVALSGAINSAVTTCVLTGTDPDVSPFLGSGFTSSEQTDDTMLLLLGSEWLSVGSVSSAGAGAYNVGILRGRLGSTAASQSDGAVGWLIRRDRATLWTNATFTQLATRYFKISYYHALAEGTLSAAKSLTFADRAPATPTGLTATALPGAIKLEWALGTDPDLKGTRIFEAATNVKPGSPSFYVAHPANTYTRDGLAGGVTRYYWIEFIDEADNVSSAAGSVNATTTSASAGADGYTVNQTMPNPQVRCDSAGTPIAGELTTPRVQTTFSVLKGTTALTATSGTPGAGQFRVLANGSGVNSTATFSTAYIELDTVSADSGYIPYKVELEGTSVFVVGQWHWVKTLAGAAGSTGPQGPTGSTGPTGPTGPTGLGFSATSSTTNTLGTGSKTWTLNPAAGAWAIGMRVRMSVVGSAYAEGQVTAYTSGTGSITISVDRVNGAGTYNSWFATAAGEVGATGPTGPTGPTGDPGPGVVYRGPFASGTAYFHTSTRRDIVLQGGTYYLVNNTGLSGSNGSSWGTPPGGNWVSFGATFSSVATAILLAEDATVIRTLVMGDGSTADGGIIRSAGATAFATGSGYWLNPRSSSHSNVAVFRVGAPGGYRISYDGTDVEIMSRRVIIGDSAGASDSVGDLQVVGEVSNRKFGSGSQNTGYTGSVAGGSLASPTATQALSFVALRMRGYDGSAWVTPASIRLRATSNFSSAFNPTEMQVLVSDGSNTHYFYVTKDGRLKTGAPSGGTAGEWKLGTVHSVSPTSPNRTIEIEVGGTTYYVAAKTTNN